MSEDVAALAAGIAAHGLSPLRSPLLDRPLDSPEWQRLLAVVTKQRLCGLLVEAARDGTVALTDVQRDELDKQRRVAGDETSALEHELAELVQTLTKAGIDHRALRGVAAAQLDYPAPSQRVFRRLELLVPLSAFDDASVLCRGMGGVRRFPEPRPGFDRRFSRGTSFVLPTGNRLVLRRTIVGGPFGMLVRPTDLFATSTPFTIGSHQLAALGTEERFLHACFYARLASVPPDLVLLRDVAQLMLSHSLDIERIEALSTAWQSEAVVADAVRLAWTTLAVRDVVPLSAWAGAHRQGRSDRRRLRAYDHSFDHAQNGAVLSFAAVRDIRPRRHALNFLRACLLPDRSYLAGRYRGHLHRWWRGAGALVHHALDRTPAHDPVPPPEREAKLEPPRGQVAPQHA